MLRYAGAVVPVFLILLLSGCYSSSRPSRVGKAAPDFTVRDSDRTVTLGQFKGQILVLNFWATYCAPCVEELPSWCRCSTHEGQRRDCAGGKHRRDENSYRRFLRDHNVTLLSVRDPEQKSNSLFGTFKIPETYIIDRNGVMRRKFIGAVDWTEPEIIDFLSKL